MKVQKHLRIGVIILISVLFQNCGSPQEVVYYQNNEKKLVVSNANSYEIKVKPDDLLLIVVSAEDPEIAMPFNLTTVSVPSATASVVTGQQSFQTYLVDSKGMIDFPVLGKLHVGDLTRTEVTGVLYEKISKYIKNPIINMRITNFKVSIQGEVNSPGTFDIKTERVTLPEALSMAKDLTIYGKRNNILIIREVNGEKNV